MPARAPDVDPVLTEQVQSWLGNLGAGPLAQLVRVQWNPRMRSTAGTAQPRTASIQLNPRLRVIGAMEVERTLRHEAAHLLAQWRAGKRRIQSHGGEWRQACADLGIPGEKVTHTLPLPRRKVLRKYCYQCPGCSVTVRRVRIFKRPTACLSCCRKHSHGQFDSRFQFHRLPLQDHS